MDPGRPGLEAARERPLIGRERHGLDRLDRCLPNSAFRNTEYEDNRAENRSIGWSTGFLIATIVHMPTSQITADRQTPTRRSPRLGVSILLVLGALLALGASSALADAGNPINGTTKGDLVQNPDGTVTAYVRGEWNWLSHGSDCNFDRAGTGLAMVWNDPTETGYTLTGKTVSAQVGVATKDGSWADPNPIDGMVHPVDRGNIPQACPGSPTRPSKPTRPSSTPLPKPPASRTRPHLARRLRPRAPQKSRRPLHRVPLGLLGL